MVQDGHLDKDLFELMLNHNLHIEYAKTFLPDEQIDVEESQNCSSPLEPETQNVSGGF